MFLTGTYWKGNWISLVDHLEIVGKVNKGALGEN
jgi:hypothetical protein